MLARILAALEQARAARDYDAETALLDLMEAERERMVRAESDRLAAEQVEREKQVRQEAERARRVKEYNRAGRSARKTAAKADPDPWPATGIDHETSDAPAVGTACITSRVCRVPAGYHLPWSVRAMAEEERRWQDLRQEVARLEARLAREARRA